MKRNLVSARTTREKKKRCLGRIASIRGTRRKIIAPSNLSKFHIDGLLGFPNGRRGSRYAGPVVAEYLRASDIGFGTVGMGDRAHGHTGSTSLFTTSGAFALASNSSLLVIETEYLPLSWIESNEAMILISQVICLLKKNLYRWRNDTRVSLR